MGRKTLDYINFTKLELENYVNDSTSCIDCINQTIHMSFPPYAMANVQIALKNILNKTMIGIYNSKLNGICLDIKNIKILSTIWPNHNDNPDLHFDIQANFYVFKPIIGSVIKGIVKYKTKAHIAVVIYRVFHVTIRLTDGNKQNIETNKEIKFKIKTFDLQNNLPYIEGELIDEFVDKKNKIVFNSDNEDENFDSGISNTDEISDQNSKKKLIKKIESNSEDSSTSSEEDISYELSHNVSKEELKLDKRFKKKESDSEECNSSSEYADSNPKLDGLSIKVEKRSSSESEGDEITNQKSESDFKNKISRLSLKKNVNRHQTKKVSHSSSDESEVNLNQLTKITSQMKKNINLKRSLKSSSNSSLKCDVATFMISRNNSKNKIVLSDNEQDLNLTIKNEKPDNESNKLTQLKHKLITPIKKEMLSNDECDGSQKSKLVQFHSKTLEKTIMSPPCSTEPIRSILQSIDRKRTSPVSSLNSSENSKLCSSKSKKSKLNLSSILGDMVTEAVREKQNNSGDSSTMIVSKLKNNNKKKRSSLKNAMSDLISKFHSPSEKKISIDNLSIVKMESPSQTVKHKQRISFYDEIVKNVL